MNNLIKDIFTLKIVPCHRKCDRSFHYKGKKFPVCARCTGLLFGYFSIIFWILVDVDISILFTILIVIFSGLPMVIDGFTQLKKYRKSNNILRLSTGLLCSIGMSFGIVEGSQYLVKMIVVLLETL